MEPGFFCELRAPLEIYKPCVASNIRFKKSNHQFKRSKQVIEEEEIETEDKQLKRGIRIEKEQKKMVVKVIVLKSSRQKKN